MPDNDPILRIEYEKRHDDMAKQMERVEIRVDKLEVVLSTKDAEAQKEHADIRREQTESYLKLLDALHGVKEEVAKDRLATVTIEHTIKEELFNNNVAAKDALTAFRADITTNRVKTVRWVIGLIATLVTGGGIGVVVEVLRVLLTGKP